MELSMEGGGTLYTARWGEDRGPITIYRQTSSGRRMLEQLVPDPDGTWTAVHTPLTAEGQPICGEYAPDIHFTADSGWRSWRLSPILTVHASGSSPDTSTTHSREARRCA